MKRILFLLSMVFVINGCGKEDKKELEFDQDGNVVSSNENWKTDPDEFKWMERKCYSRSKLMKSDARVKDIPECVEFKEFYKKKTGKTLI
ncbi:MAG: hypothetical protein N4Q30_00840 [Neisseriaceae bacterium]|nr:hypothetical protein [Neisseriaceae bacterium]